MLIKNSHKKKNDFIICCIPNFICSGIQDLDLSILKTLTPLSFRNVLQPAVPQIAPGMIHL